jgi:NTE family protein
MTETVEPVSRLAQDHETEVEDGVGLAISGGGYRAMLFHLGSFLRLFELGLLPKLTRISSVSGGSITAAKIALEWEKLQSDDPKAFFEHVVEPIRKVAGKTIDAPSIIGGILLPGSVAARLWRFSKPYMADWRLGQVKKPAVSLADAVTASSAFPPVLSPFVLEVGRDKFEEPNEEFEHRFFDEIALTDGGVYDNLGLETVWKRFKTVLVSDAGGKIGFDATPPANWAGHAKRVLDIIHEQVSSVRKRQVIASFRNEDREGAYWGIRTNIEDYKLPDSLKAPRERTLALAETPTRLKRLDAEHQERLINWGYAVCDAAIRAHWKPDGATVGKFPYDRGI